MNLRVDLSRADTKWLLWCTFSQGNLPQSRCATDESAFAEAASQAARSQSSAITIAGWRRRITANEVCQNGSEPGIEKSETGAGSPSHRPDAASKPSDTDDAAIEVLQPLRDTAQRGRKRFRKAHVPRPGRGK
eukprot:5002729-Pleurochrysis_carterae.AAC.1